MKPTSHIFIQVRSGSEYLYSGLGINPLNNIMKIGTKQFARAGADSRWSKYRQHLIDEVRSLVTKEQLDFFLIAAPFTKKGSYRMWRECLMELRKRKHG